MDSPDLRLRAGLLHASLRRVRHEVQHTGSGATIHLLVNRIATAHAALLLVETRAASVPREQLVELLNLADISLRDARAVMAQNRQRGPQEPAAPARGA